ncbi:MAG: hypothetical protein AAGC79_05930 [Pseudomonadota bacterium]
MWKMWIGALAGLAMSSGVAQAITLDLTIGGPNPPTILLDAFGTDDLAVTAGSEVPGAEPLVATNGSRGLGVSGFPEGRRLAQQASTGFNEFLILDFGQTVRVTAIEIFSTFNEPQSFSFGVVGESPIDLETPQAPDNSDQFTSFNLDFVGTQFRLTGTEPNGGNQRGVMISGITVSQVPLPGGLLLVLSGLAALGYTASPRQSA